MPTESNKLSMLKSVHFTDYSIQDFCRITLDDNHIHNPDFMSPMGKQVVVPGMFIFAIAAKLAAAHVSKIRHIHVLFGSMISRGDAVRIGYEVVEDGIRLLAVNGDDCLSIRDEHSVASIYPRVHEISSDGRIQQLRIEEKQLDRFHQLTGEADKAVNDFLFAVAYASKALNMSIGDPYTETETEINKLIDTSVNPARSAPFYQTLDIHLPEKGVSIDSGQIDYAISYIREKKNRSYLAHAHCSQNGQTIYHSVYRMIAIPERLILRMFKDL